MVWSGARFGVVAILLAVLWSSPVAAGEPEDYSVTVRLKSGGTIRGQLVEQDAEAVRIAYPDGGTVRLPRSLIERFEGGPPPTAGKPAAVGPISTPAKPSTTTTGRTPGTPKPWSAEQERLVEQLLDRYFSADEGQRDALWKELERTPLPCHQSDLEQMRLAAQDAKPFMKHVPVPWRSGTPRGWFNLALPKGYTPAKAWPLVLALHGMPSDGDNLVSWYSGYFPAKGYLVLFPTTVHPGSFWPAPDEKQELLRLLRHLCHLYRVDYRRIYCTGASGGGIGTWQWLVTLPDLFAGGISISAAGTVFDQRLARLKGVPFYVHHGAADAIPVESVQRAVEAARRYGADKIEFYESPGTGHTPPKKDWNRAFDWLAALPPRQPSARHLLETPEGALPLGYPRYLPFTATAGLLPFDSLAPGGKPAALDWKVPEALAGNDPVSALAGVAKIVDPSCDADRLRSQIKRIAETVTKRLTEKPSGTDKLYALNEVFFQVEGFAPESSEGARPDAKDLLIPSILKNRRGNAFALTALYVAAAAELGLPVRAVVSPYHAFARYDDGQEQVNVETTEMGGHFGDAVYREGYGLARLPTAADLKARGIGPLVAPQAALLAAHARRSGDGATAAALTKLALSLDGDCYGALMLKAMLARDEKNLDEAIRAVRRAVTLWPAYGAPRLVEGYLLQQSGRDTEAVAAYRAGITARLKPPAAAAAYDAEMYYRIAAVYAPLARKAIETKSASAIGHLNQFNEAIVNCLRNNPAHSGARALLAEMGGRFTIRAP